MKTFLYLLTICVLLSSCGSLYNTHVNYWYLSQSPTYGDCKELDAQNRCKPIYDTLGVMEKSWRQAWQDKSDSKLLFWAGTAIIAGSMTTAGIDDANGNKFILPACVAVVGGIIAGTSMEWGRWNSGREISKSKYDSIMKSGADFSSFWK